ncbi:MAG: DUF2012 domain-containing protein [Muribaculaceae bacterium]|nr:DUF2012 domain-containing protein [Muribaculaceae bacterium]
MTEGSIAGSVSDRTTGEPVATVNVTLSPGGNSTVTGSDGSFDFRNLEPGSYTLTINKEGYKQNSAEVYVKAGDPTSAHLLIERIPGIVTADRETLDFGENQSLNTLSFNIVNSSYEDLAWEIEERCEWITEIKPEKGTLAYGKTEGIVVVIDRDKLNAGENKAVIVIRSSQGSSQMNVTVIGAEHYLPKLNTLTPTEITSTSAVFNGEIIDEGVPAYSERGFVYSLTKNPTLENTIAKLTCPISFDMKYSFKVTELIHSQTYYVRAYAKNNAGVAYSSNEIKFNTDIPKPEVVTLDVANVDFSAGTATFRGEITFVGDPAYIERGFVYGTLPEPTINENKVVANGTGEVGKFSKYMTDLPKNTYYVRAYASTPVLTVYGEEKVVSSEWIEIPAAGIAVQREDLGNGYWSTADAMCKSSTLGGYTDWRLPTKEELMVLYNNREMIGGFITAPRNSSGYWSSSSSSGWYYYCIYFSNGNIENWYKDTPYNVRAVRTISK